MRSCFEFASSVFVGIECINCDLIMYHIHQLYARFQTATSFFFKKIQCDVKVHREKSVSNVHFSFVLHIHPIFPSKRKKPKKISLLSSVWRVTAVFHKVYNMYVTNEAGTGMGLTRARGKRTLQRARSPDFRPHTQLFARVRNDNHTHPRALTQPTTRLRSKQIIITRKQQS